MKKKNKIVKFIDLGIVALAVIALIMIFLPAVSVTVMKETQSWNGLKVVFGYTEKTQVLASTVSTEVFKFSFLNLLTYLLVIGTGVCAALSFTKKKSKLTLLASILALVAAVFFLLTKTFVVLPEGAAKAYEVLDTSFAKEANLGAGPIIGAICMFLAAIAGGAKTFLDK